MLSQANYLLMMPTFATSNLAVQVQRSLFVGCKGLIRQLCHRSFAEDEASCLLLDSHPINTDPRLRFRANVIKPDVEHSQLVYIQVDP